MTGRKRAALPAILTGIGVTAVLGFAALTLSPLLNLNPASPTPTPSAPIQEVDFTDKGDGELVRPEPVETLPAPLPLEPLPPAEEPQPEPEPAPEPPPAPTLCPPGTVAGGVDDF